MDLIEIIEAQHKALVATVEALGALIKGFREETPALPDLGEEEPGAEPPATFGTPRRAAEG